ncbi:MAG TPA: hypothetical protein VMZ53_04945 [Kofleriaceae bacterium]|nr:hypothetical protein [Kofleriaceae bacterium]
MRVWVAMIVLVLCNVAAAEPRASVGFRATWNTDASPPPWLMTGGQWGLRLRGTTWLMLDGDGMRGEKLEHVDGSASQRTFLVLGLGLTTDVIAQGRNALRVLGGGGVVVELAHERMLGTWDTADVATRPLGYVGAAFEHRFPQFWVEKRKKWMGGGEMGVEVRAVRLFGDGAMTPAPGIAATSMQASLQMSAYF